MMQPLTFVILSTGLDSIKELRGALAAHEEARLLVASDEIEQLHPEIARLRPDAVIITLGAETEAGLRYVERVASEFPRTAVICAGRDSSPDLILRSLRAGARDFLRLPVREDEFATVVARTHEFCSSLAEAPKKRGRAVSVFSSKGGCGTSFLATNLAASISAPTVLVDLNLQAGDLALYLGAQPKYSVADLVEHRARVDDTLLKTYLAPHSQHLSLLAAPGEPDLADDIEAEHVFEMIELLRERHDYVVIDPQHTFDSITLAALDQSDEIILVLTLDIPAIRSTQRTLQIFDRLGYPRHKVRVVVNRWSKQIELDEKQVERYLGERVVGHIQSDYNVAVNSINLGKPLVESDPQSRIAQEIRQIADAVTGTTSASPVTAPRRGLWQSIFKRPVGKADAAGGLGARFNKEAVSRQQSAFS